MIVAHEDRFGAAITTDFGSVHPSMIGMLDTNPVITRISFFEQHLEEWMQPTPVELGREHGSSSAYVIQVPLGVDGNIAPCNFPIESALVMTVDMLAAGNTVIVKPSELAPATSQAPAVAIEEIFDPTVMAVVLGGPEVAAAFCRCSGITRPIPEAAGLVAW